MPHSGVVPGERCGGGQRRWALEHGSDVLTVTCASVCVARGVQCALSVLTALLLTPDSWDKQSQPVSVTEIAYVG
eukprot:7300323-Alexandrium_andersonii.AAC.1